MIKYEIVPVENAKNGGGMPPFCRVRGIRVVGKPMQRAPAGKRGLQGEKPRRPKCGEEGFSPCEAKLFAKGEKYAICEKNRNSG